MTGHSHEIFKALSKLLSNYGCLYRYLYQLNDIPTIIFSVGNKYI